MNLFDRVNQAMGKKPAEVTVEGDTIVAKIMCVMCREDKVVRVPLEGYTKWKAGMFIQEAIPTASAADRELLISHICNDCYGDMFEDDDDDEGEDEGEDDQTDQAV
jgi:hypothetical protein